MKDATYRTILLALLAGVLLFVCLRSPGFSPSWLASVEQRNIDASASAYHEIPSSNRVDWSIAGVPGGPVYRTTIYTNLTSAATHTDINNAIAAAGNGTGTNGKVVVLANGTYTLTGSIVWGTNQYVSLRGESRDGVVLNSSAAFPIKPDGGENYASHVGYQGLSSGFTKGSTSVVFSATPTGNIFAGMSMLIRSTDNPNMTYASDLVGASTVGTNYGSIHNILTVDGTTVTFTPPLPWTHLTNVFASHLNSGTGRFMLTGIGIENLTVNCDQAVWGITMVGCQKSWLTNVVVTNYADAAIVLYNGLHNEMRQVQVRVAKDWPAQGDGQGILMNNFETAWRVEDSIFDRTACALILEKGVNSGYFGYNFVTNTEQSSANRQLPDVYLNHGVAPMMNLFEGNWLAKIGADNYHGSSSSFTFFRNSVSGVSGTREWRIPFDIMRGAYFYNILANVIGDSSWEPQQFIQYNATNAYSAKSPYRFGFPNQGNESLTEDITPTDGNAWSTNAAYQPFFPNSNSYPDLRVEATMVKHGNWDNWHDTIINSNGLATSFSNSLVYASRPSWLPAGYPWPMYDPATPQSNLAARLPAYQRFITP